MNPLRRRAAACLGVLLAALAVAGCSETVRLSAPPGQFNARTLGEAKADLSFSSSARLLAFNPSPAWLPAAYVGVHEGADRGNSLQVYAAREQPSDAELALHYRVIVGGQQVRTQRIGQVPLKGEWKVAIRFQSGVADVQVEGGPSLRVTTPFRQVAPYVSVSSGEAEFVVRP